MKLKLWIQAARLRTLPLSVSGIIVGSALAFSRVGFNALLFGLLMLTTILLQVLSNFANDVGDFEHGTDNAERVGPQRGLQAGGLSLKEMKCGVAVAAVVAFLSGVAMLYTAFGIDANFWAFLAFGILTIIAALRYTMGRNPYGYRGLGDVMVLVFFGWATTIGSYYIICQQITWQILVLGFGIGFLSMGVLNINNMRDAETDAKTGKRTIIVKLGVKFGQVYHLILCVLGVSAFAVCILADRKPLALLWILPPAVLLIMHGIRIFTCSNVKTIDPELKKLSLSTLLMAVLFGLCVVFG
ncbi:MAG: 1,4-dihydroxy-2-naphthoate octaprenyltransferase [Salinivirgaceae bacterium]|nr:1,4-dihydroxy-2-naphthoate octaprenyltransferase [Salinivirgaceae bacterium]